MIAITKKKLTTMSLSFRQLTVEEFGPSSDWLPVRSLTTDANESVAALCPQSSKLPVSRPPRTAAQESLLGKMEGEGPNRPGMLAQGIRILETVGAKVVSGWGAVGDEGRGRIEVLFEGPQAVHDRLAVRMNDVFHDEARYTCYRVPCPNPATVVVTVIENDRMEGELTDELASLRCDIIQTFPGVSLLPTRLGLRLAHSFACLISRPPRLTREMIVRRLRRLARRRRGAAVVVEGCLKLCSEQDWLL